MCKCKRRKVKTPISELFDLLSHSGLFQVTMTSAAIYTKQCFSNLCHSLSLLSLGDQNTGRESIGLEKISKNDMR